jgi:hypothetical protein
VASFVFGQGSDGIASTAGREASAKSAAAPPFASTAGRKPSAKSATAPPFASTAGRETSAKTVYHWNKLSSLHGFATGVARLCSVNNVNTQGFAQHATLLFLPDGNKLFATRSCIVCLFPPLPDNQVLGGCQSDKTRPDICWIGQDRIVHLEIDEHSHEDREVSCELKKLDSANWGV